MDQDKILISLMQVFIAQMDSALKISTIISEHSDEEEMSPDSLVIGLIYRLMISMEEEEMNKSMKEAEHILNKESSSEEDEEELYEDETDETVKTDETAETKPRRIRTNTCNCNICAKARACILNYQTYEVNDQLAQKFKDAIDNTCRIHKLQIN
tara:strand:- start:22039 stop:22503 length:465 start_codon:yes stop_codon:yes gene_type:complete